MWLVALGFNFNVKMRKIILRATPSAAPAPFGYLLLPFGEFGASILAPCDTISALREHLGARWDQQDGLEGVRHRIFIDFEGNSWPYFEIFLGTEAWNFNFVSGLLPGQFLTASLIGIWTPGALKSKFPYRAYSRKHLFTEIVFYVFRGVLLLSFFGSLRSSFSDFCCSGSRLEN